MASPDTRELRDTLERLQTEIRALERKRDELVPKVARVRRAAETAEAGGELVQRTVWRLRTENARLKGDPPRPESKSRVGRVVGMLVALWLLSMFSRC